MNAYELPVWQMSVDEVKALIETNRQQADRIAELEEQNEALADEYAIQVNEVCKLFYEIENLKAGLLSHNDIYSSQEKQSEPVAWMQMHHKDNIPTKFSPVKVWEDDIPLYTTPQTKPLSDEEIIKIFNQIWNDGGNTNGVMHRFARAIEAKVRGEK